MRPETRILCVGAAHWDLIGRSDLPLRVGDDAPGRIERGPGGVAANIAVGLARHGVPVSLCTVVGDDEAGRTLLSALAASGIDCTPVLRVTGGMTGHYLAIEDHRGELFAAIAEGRLLETHADAVASRAEAAMPDAGAVLLEANLGGEALRRIADAARRFGVEIVANPVSPAKAPRLAFLLDGGLAPTIIANLAEANRMLGADHRQAHEAAIALQARCGGTALITSGAQPAALAGPDALYTAIPPEAPRGGSVTGAGDALVAACLASPHRRSSPGDALRAALAAATEHMRPDRSQ